MSIIFIPLPLKSSQAKPRNIVINTHTNISHSAFSILKNYEFLVDIRKTLSDEEKTLKFNSV